MNKLYKLILLIPILLVGCKTSRINHNKISQRIDSLNMNIYSNEGDKLYKINSPFSYYDRNNNIFKLKETTIHLFKKNNIEYIIKSDKSKLSKNNNLLELNGNVKLKTVLQEDDKISGNKFTWDINNTYYILTGNVKFENKKIFISSEKAILNNENKLEFFNPVKYIIKDNNNQKSYEVNSENAYYDINTKTLNFESNEKRVRSKLYF